MKGSASLDVLLAQIQIQIPGLNSLLITSPRPDRVSEVVARRIAGGLADRGIATAVYLQVQGQPGDSAMVSAGSRVASARAKTASKVKTFDSAEAGTPELAKALLASEEGVAIAVASGILENPSALFLAVAVDAVLVVVEARRTKRSDVQHLQVELAAVGGRLVAAVLVE